MFYIANYLTMNNILVWHIIINYGMAIYMHIIIQVYVDSASTENGQSHDQVIPSTSVIAQDA